MNTAWQALKVLLPSLFMEIRDTIEFFWEATFGKVFLNLPKRKICEGNMIQ